MIAYEALLCSWRTIDPNNKQEKTKKRIKLCKCSMFHGGYSDSTEIIASACWGAMEGFNRVPENHYSQLQYSKKFNHMPKIFTTKQRLTEIDRIGIQFSMSSLLDENVCT